jgi:hypothetical protein
VPADVTEPAFLVTFRLTTGESIVADLYLDAARQAVKAATVPGPHMRFSTEILPIIETDRAVLLAVIADVWGAWATDGENSPFRVTETGTGRIWSIGSQRIVAMGFEDPSAPGRPAAGFAVEQFRKTSGS